MIELRGNMDSIISQLKSCYVDKTDQFFVKIWVVDELKQRGDSKKK